MPNHQVQIAIVLLWASVALGVMNLALHGWLTYQATGQFGASSPLIISAALFIFVQARLILRLHSGQAAVRGRLALITIIRIAALAPSAQALFAIMPAFIILPVISAVLQFVALALVFLPPGSAHFSKPALARR
jgi:hypothetical protein